MLAGLVRKRPAVHDRLLSYGLAVKTNPRRKASEALWSIILTLAFSILAVGSRPFWSGWWLFLIGVALAQAWSALRETAETLYDAADREDSETVEVTTHALSDGLRHIQDKVTDVVLESPSKRSAASKELARLAVSTLLQTYHGSVRGARVTVFILNSDWSRADPVESRGRHDVPRPFLSNGEHRDTLFFEWLASNDKQPRFQADTHVRTDGDRREPSVHYRTYISALIYNSRGTYGMLTVDAKEPASLDERDKHLIQAFACELATAFAVALPPVEPDGTDRRAISKKPK
ncbi:hypothetical protein [Nesterenkonia sp. PF2B19]|uniref:hypothetical protein n=1 Tax=Nesterenkonia sp. PF2B19 TaxID=1881858 RepID=UPI000872273F|nr:hypothetical protein [Nesterenkonia sp. PF2B19]OSM43446.1 hypothetical protein BCY76_007980 [Nesterenkonia sp. PF2B19]